MPARSGVLVVCTANVCRSPAAAHLLAEALGPSVPVSSAGLQARPGEPACPLSAGEAGLDAAVHRANRVGPTALDQAALVLTFTRDQRAELVRLAPAAQRRCFTLGQAARTAAWLLDQDAYRSAPARGGRAAAPSAVSLAAELDSTRGLVPRTADPADDDLPDPHGLGDQVHLDAMDRIHDWVDTLGRLWQQLQPAATLALRGGNAH